MNDLYLKLVLTVIAVALVVIALRGFGPIVPPAYASDTVNCRITDWDTSDKVPVEMVRWSVSDEVRVELTDGPGTSSSELMYVVLTDRTFDEMPGNSKYEPVHVKSAD